MVTRSDSLVRPVVFELFVFDDLECRRTSGARPLGILIHTFVLVATMLVTWKVVYELDEIK